MPASKPYLIQFLSTQPLQLDNEKLLPALKSTLGEVDAMSAKEGFHAFACLDYPVQYADGEVPAQLIMSTHTGAVKAEDQTAGLQQSWNWREAKEIVPQCQHIIMLMDLMAKGLPYQQRLQLMRGAVKALLSVVRCEAIFWQPSQQFFSPQLFLMNWENPLWGALNVRLFNVQVEGSTEQQTLMDTMGLAALGLPDVQCHFMGLEPNDMARLLYNVGAYLFERGDIINDGETVAGLQESDRWVCRHEVAILAPEREVLDINPGERYAAGNRH